MAFEKVNIDVVRAIATMLEGVEESTTFGVPSFKVRGKLMTCPAIHKSAEPNSLVVCVGFTERDELMGADPRVYYLTDHYLDHPVVLVRLEKIDRNALEGLIHMAWRFVGAKAAGRGRSPRARVRD